MNRFVLSARLRTADAADLLLRRRDPLTPPRRLNFVGNSDFEQTGEEFLIHFRELASLSPSDQVLDVGCGIGRMARVLTRALAPPSGAYDGFDINADGIRWCQRHYRSLPVPFRFVHADIYNGEYNPTGLLDAGSFRFPYSDASFSLVIATSVFTHLLTNDALHYLSEIARVLRPGGRLFATWFLIEPGLPAGSPPPLVNFAHPLGDAMVADPSTPEAAVAYPQPWVDRALAHAGLTLREPIARGSWATGTGRTPQDLLVADRAAGAGQ